MHEYSRAKVYGGGGHKSMMNEKPPSFYEEDLERFKNKFRASIENR